MTSTAQLQMRINELVGQLSAAQTERGATLQQALQQADVLGAMDGWVGEARAELAAAQALNTRLHEQLCGAKAAGAEAAAARAQLQAKAGGRAPLHDVVCWAQLRVKGRHRAGCAGSGRTAPHACIRYTHTPGALRSRSSPRARRRCAATRPR